MSEDPHKAARHARIRRVKRFLRPLPRRGNIHNYPILRFFSDTAHKCHFLWSFRSTEVIPALYAGFILSLTPFFGIQTILAFLLALLFRANLPILIALQFITNPFTIGPIYFVAFKVGDQIINLFSFLGNWGGSLDPIDPESYTEATGQKFTTYVKKATYWYAATTLGGALLGYFCGLISSKIYQNISRKHKKVDKSKR